MFLITAPGHLVRIADTYREALRVQDALQHEFLVPFYVRPVAIVAVSA